MHMTQISLSDRVKSLEKKDVDASTQKVNFVYSLYLSYLLPMSFIHACFHYCLGVPECI